MVTSSIIEGSIAGESIVPFESQGYEGFDINEPIDLIVAKSLEELKPIALRIQKTTLQSIVL